MDKFTKKQVLSYKSPLLKKENALSTLLDYGYGSKEEVAEMAKKFIKKDIDNSWIVLYFKRTLTIK